MAGRFNYQTKTRYVEATSSDNVFVGTVGAEYTAYVAGDKFSMKANHTITDSATLNINGLGAKTIKNLSGSALADGEIASGDIVEMTYNGTDLIITGMTRIMDGGSY